MELTIVYSYLLNYAQKHQLSIRFQKPAPSNKPIKKLHSGEQNITKTGKSLINNGVCVILPISDYWKSHPETRIGRGNRDVKNGN